MRILFKTELAAGFEFEINGQGFKLIERQPHVKMDGSKIDMMVWQGECAECRDHFITKSPEGFGPEGRRCSKHKAPGRKVST
jgi:hypothetical protein